MLRLSKLADYGVVIVATLALRNEPLMNATRLAELTTLPGPTVAKLLKRMAKAGIVSATRGAAGGYRLARPARDITTVELIEAVDGPISLTSCAQHIKAPCEHANACPVFGRWSPLNAKVREAFKAVTLDQLISAEYSFAGTSTAEGAHVAC